MSEALRAVLSQPESALGFLEAALGDAHAARLVGGDADEDTLIELGRAAAALGVEVPVEQLSAWAGSRDGSAVSLLAQLLGPLWTEARRPPPDAVVPAVARLAARADSDQARFDLGVLLARIARRTQGPARKSALDALEALVSRPLGEPRLDGLLRQQVAEARRVVRAAPL